jgi:hypothetical protein
MLKAQKESEKNAEEKKNKLTLPNRNVNTSSKSFYYINNMKVIVFYIMNRVQDKNTFFSLKNN